MAGVYDWFTVLSESYVIGQNALVSAEKLRPFRCINYSTWFTFNLSYSLGKTRPTG